MRLEDSGQGSDQNQHPVGEQGVGELLSKPGQPSKGCKKEPPSLIPRAVAVSPRRRDATGCQALQAATSIGLRFQCLRGLDSLGFLPVAFQV